MEEPYSHWSVRASSALELQSTNKLTRNSEGGINTEVGPQHRRYRHVGWSQFLFQIRIIIRGFIVSSFLFLPLKWRKTEVWFWPQRDMAVQRDGRTSERMEECKGEEMEVKERQEEIR